MMLALLPSAYGGQVIFASNIPSQVRTLTRTPLYVDCDVMSEFVKDNQNQDVYLKEGTQLRVDTTFADTMFYKVYTFNVYVGAGETDFAYVLISQTLDATITSPTQRLDTNATIKNDNVPVYRYYENDNSYSQTEINLKKDTKVRVLDGYDSSKKYTYISYQNENGTINYGYVLTSDLAVEGINYSIIVAISILIVCISLLLIIFGLKGKKKKKK